jgi:hypothetical protein
MSRMPPTDVAFEQWRDGIDRWALPRAAAGLLAPPLPSQLWVFDYDLRKVSRRARHTATISLGQAHLRHLGLKMGDVVRLLPRKDGTITIKKASAKDLRQANPYTRLTAIAGRKGRKAAS